VQAPRPARALCPANDVRRLAKRYDRNREKQERKEVIVGVEKSEARPGAARLTPDPQRVGQVREGEAWQSQESASGAGAPEVVRSELVHRQVELVRVLAEER